MDSLLVVTNAAAGSADADAVTAAVGALDETYTVEVAATEDVDELRDVLAGRAGRTVVVVGGDGSLHAVVSVLQAEGWLEDTVLALVPLGTGNDFARTLGLPLDAAEAARAVRTSTERRLDLLVEDDGEEVVVNAAHFGVGVDAADQADDFKARFGAVGYVIGAARAGFVSRGLRLRVEVDGEVVADGKHHVLQVAVANGRFVGGGTPLMPDADPGDGRADVVLSYALAPAKRFAYAVGVRLGRHERREDVQTRTGQRVVVSGPDVRRNVDGELKGPGRRSAWTVRPGVLRMLCPAVTDATG